MKPLQHNIVATDIVSFLANQTQEEQVQRAFQMMQDAAKLIAQGNDYYGGYMVVTMFVAAFSEMKLVLQAAQGKDKELIQQVMQATIGSFGRTVQ